MSDHSAIAVDAWEALFRAQVVVLRELNSEFPADLSLNEYDVLYNLSRQPDRKTRIRDLNRLLMLTQPSVSRLIDRLVSRGLVTKTADPGDGRGIIVALTDAGYELFHKVALSHGASIIKRVGGALTDEELLQLTALCTKLRVAGED